LIHGFTVLRGLVGVDHHHVVVAATFTVASIVEMKPGNAATSWACSFSIETELSTMKRGNRCRSR
jgi:hypothetical protein